MPKVSLTNRKTFSLFGINRNSKDKNLNSDKSSSQNFNKNFKKKNESSFSSKYQRKDFRYQNFRTKSDSSTSNVKNIFKKAPELKKQSFKKTALQNKRNEIISRRQKVGLKFRLAAKFAIDKPTLKGAKEFSTIKRSDTRKKRKFFNKRFLFVLLIPILLLIIVVTAVQTQLFDVKEIDITGSTQTNTNDIRNYVRKNGGSGLIFNISPARLKKNHRTTVWFCEVRDN